MLLDLEGDGAADPSPSHLTTTPFVINTFRLHEPADRRIFRQFISLGHFLVT
jgi:hypothetical protein